MPEHTNSTSLVGSVFERPLSLALHRPPQPSKTGFPAAQHCSKSAFARRRDEERKMDNNQLQVQNITAEERERERFFTVETQVEEISNRRDRQASVLAYLR